MWKTMKQFTIPLSSAEAEYIALYEATIRDMVWTKGSFNELGVKVKTSKCWKITVVCNYCYKLCHHHDKREILT